MDKRRWGLSAWGLLFLGLAIGVLSLGAVHTVWVRVVASLMACAAVAATCSRSTRSRASSWISLAFMGIGAWSLLQLVPIPPGLRALLDPVGFEAWRQGWLAAFGEPPPGWWRALSLDPAATADRALRMFTLALVAHAAVNLRSSSRERPAGVVAALALGAAAFAQARALIWGAEPTNYWGLHTTTIPMSGLTTFVNTNQGAALFGLGALMAVTALIESGSTGRRPVWSVVLSSCVAGAVFLRSDGVFLALFVAVGGGLLVYAGASLRVLAAAAIGLVLLGWVSIDAEVSASIQARTDLTVAALRASADHWLVGSGAGSVGNVLVPYASDTVLARHNAPVVENDPVEWLLTLGWPMTLAALAVFMTSGVAPWRHAHASPSKRRAGAMSIATWLYAAVLALFHFPTFIIGLGAPLVFAFESTSKVSHVPWASRLRGRGAQWSLSVGIAGACVAALATFALVSVPDDALKEHLEAEGALAEAVAATPTRARVYAAAAASASSSGERERAVRLMERAFALEPRLTVRVAYAQALGDAGEAPERIIELLAPAFSPDAPESPDRYMANILGVVPDADDRVVLIDGSGERTLEMFMREVQRIDGRTRLETFLVAFIERRPDDVFPKRALARLYLDTARPELAEIWLVLALDDHPEDREVFASYIETLAATGRLARADELMWAAARRQPDDQTVHALVLMWWARARPELGAVDGGRMDALRRVSGGLCATSSAARRRTCAELELWLVESRGELERAGQLHEIWAKRLDDPRGWSSFLARHGKCIELQHASARWRARAPENAARARSAWSVQLEACRAR